jgi:hypothetical protein
MFIRAELDRLANEVPNARNKPLSEMELEVLGDTAVARERLARFVDHVLMAVITGASSAE